MPGSCVPQGGYFTVVLLQCFCLPSGEVELVEDGVIDVADSRGREQLEGGRMRFGESEGVAELGRFYQLLMSSYIKNE